MKIRLKHDSFFGRALLFSTALAAAGPAYGGFQYNDRDVVLGFRQSGAINEMVVDLGQVSNYYNLPAGTTITITNYSVAALTNAFPSLDALQWSVSSDVHNNTVGDPSYPLYSLWVTRPRANLNTPTSAWARQSQFAQGTVSAKVSGIGNNAVIYGGTVPSGTNNTSTMVVIPSGNTYAYSPEIGSAGNFAATFQGDAEQITPYGFADGGVPVAADFYQLLPGSGAGTYVGVFKLGTDGTMTFTAGPPQPAITISSRGGTNTIAFTTVTGAGPS